MKCNRRVARGQRGFAALYVLFASMVLIPVAGLAIDFSVLYNVKGRLQAAVDAAAIDAGYLMQRSTNLSDPTQVAAIQSTSQRYFNANFPSNYWGSTPVSYSATPSQNATTKVRTLNVQASELVPMLFMRVIGINTSTVAAQATVSVRYTNLMIVVDRSGSVLTEGANTTIVNVLTQFVANSSTSTFVDGRDVVGMVTFGGAWRLDFPPTTSFQSGSPNIGTAINNIAWGNNGTNTADGLYQAWYQLRKLNQPGALNVILLLTDGRPSGFTGNFTSTANCHTASPHGGVVQSYVNLGSSYPYWPPPTTGADVFGVISSTYQGSSEVNYLGTNSTGCSYATQVGNPETNLPNDIPTFPNLAGPIDNVDGTIPAYTAAGVSTIAGYYPSPGNSTSNPRSVRYAAFNVADNIATLIRQDTVINPVLFVIGLTYSDELTEPLDSDWLARVANDPTYTIQTSDPAAGTTAGNPVYQSGQTQGWYYQSSQAGLLQAFQNVSSQIMRLSQ
ncbi:MAG TPA: vWA domain-containing protein [Bryobacteraceae bacterium]|nr:vWA domain-containing protein [Bryobacteraceae bacterium]